MTITPAGARSIVLTSAAIIAASSILRDIRRGDVPSVSIPIGAGMFALFLGSVAKAAPTGAASFAALGAVAALVRDPNEYTALAASLLARRAL